MIRQRTEGAVIDRTLIKDVEQSGMLLKQLARQANSGKQVQLLAAKSFVAAAGRKEMMHAEVVFLTEKQDDHPAIQRIKSWVGIRKELPAGDIFDGKVSGNVVLDNIILKIQLYHFDHYPARKLSEDKKALKVVIYDTAYKEQYKNWMLAVEVLGKDPAVCVAVNIQPVSEASGEEGFQAVGLETKQLGIGDLGTSVKELFEDEDMKRKLQLVRFKNYVHHLNTLYQLILLDIKAKTRQFRAKVMLNHKKQWQHQQKGDEFSIRDISQLKVMINTRLKRLTKTIDQALDSFDKEDQQYMKLGEDILSFFGFVEQKSGKNLTFRMAEGAVQDKVDKANTALSGFFDKTIQNVNQQFNDSVGEIKKQLKSWNMPSVDQVPEPEPIAPISEGYLLDSNAASGKTYEKQIPAKGIGSLLMELRTPLFMLMPFMMIFALFGALVKGGDTGTIDDAIRFHEGKPALAITQLPESWNNQYLEFFEEVEKQREKGYFDKEFSDDLTREPQLAVVEREVSQRYGDSKIEEELDRYFDRDRQTIYLYLKENADRNFVAEKLMEPGSGLLSVKSSSRGGSFGIGGLIRAMSGLSEYRYLILVGFSGLILWFIITRKRGMARELRSVKEKEQKKLNEDLKQQLDKSIKQQLQRWKLKLTDELNSRYTALQQNIEGTVNKTIENRKQQKAQEYKIIQKRMATIKSEKMLLTSLKGDQRKISTKLNELRTKIARMA